MFLFKWSSALEFLQVGSGTSKGELTRRAEAGFCRLNTLDVSQLTMSKH